MFEAIRRQLGRSVPFARLLGIEVDAVDALGASTRVVEQPQLNNHVGTFHAGVLFTACESASGAALAGALASVIMRTRFVVREARIAYLKPAKGELTAQARLVDDAAAVLDALERLGRAEVVVDVSARTASGATGEAPIVAKASFTWHLRLQAD